MITTLWNAFWPTVGIFILLASIALVGYLIWLANAARRSPEVTSAEDGQRNLRPENEIVNCPCKFQPVARPVGKPMQQYFHARMSARKEAK